MWCKGTALEGADQWWLIKTSMATLPVKWSKHQYIYLHKCILNDWCKHISFSMKVLKHIPVPSITNGLANGYTKCYVTKE